MRLSGVDEYDSIMYYILVEYGLLFLSWFIDLINIKYDGYESNE